MNWMSKEEVRELRKRLGLKQRELAERLNVNVRTVRRWEAMGARSSAATLLRQMEEEAR